MAAPAVLALPVWLERTDADRHRGSGRFSGTKQPRGSADEGTSLCVERETETHTHTQTDRQTDRDRETQREVSGAEHEHKQTWKCARGPLHRHGRVHSYTHSQAGRRLRTQLHSTPFIHSHPHRACQALSWKIQSNSVSLTVKLMPAVDNLFNHFQAVVVWACHLNKKRPKRHSLSHTAAHDKT